jgi:hypothetical protein
MKRLTSMGHFEPCPRRAMVALPRPVMKSIVIGNARRPCHIAERLMKRMLLWKMVVELLTPSEVAVAAQSLPTTGPMHG